MQCPQCGLELPEDALFCPDCGHRLGQEAATVTAGATEAAPEPAAKTLTQKEASHAADLTDKKRSTLPLIALLVLLLAAAGVVAFLRLSAPRTVAITAEIFPDDTLRSYVAEELDSDGDGKLSAAEASTVTKISLDGVINARGFENFPNLTELSLGGGTLTNALINAPKLEKLDISNSSELTELQFEVPVPELKTLNAEGTAIEKLDLGQSTKLEDVTVPEGTEVILPEELSDDDSVKQIIHATKRAGSAPAIWIVESVTGKLSRSYGSAVFEQNLTNTGSYNEDGRLVSRNGVTSTGSPYTEASYKYDALGRLITYVSSAEGELAGGVFSENWTAIWSDDGRTASWTGSGNGPSMSATMTFNELGLPVSFEGRDMHMGQQSARSTASYAYDDEGRLVKLDCAIEYVPVDAGWRDNYEVRISYHDNGELAKISIADTSTYSSYACVYTFDEQGRIVSREDPQMGSVTYTYDASGALTSASGENMTATFTADENGNVKTAEYTYLQDGTTETSVSYELTWREVEAYADGSYPYGVVSSLDPLGLSSDELFGAVVAGNPTTLLELERLIRKSQAVSVAGVQEMPTASETETTAATEQTGETAAIVEQPAATDPETSATSDDGEWYEDEYIRVKAPDSYERYTSFGSPLESSGYKVAFEQLNQSGSRSFILFYVLVLDGTYEEAGGGEFGLVGQTSQGYNVYVYAPSNNYDEIVSTLTIK